MYLRRQTRRRTVKSRGRWEGAGVSRRPVLFAIFLAMVTGAVEGFSGRLSEILLTPVRQVRIYVKDFGGTLRPQGTLSLKVIRADGRVEDRGTVPE